MITAERKPLDEIAGFLKPYKNILICGCGACVTVCFAGGEKEVGILASELKILKGKSGGEIKIIEQTVKRQCEAEFAQALKENIEKTEAVLSLSCGAGVQFIAEYFPGKPVFPGVNTKFLGGTKEPGLWEENCLTCGDCVLDRTAGVCPIARCSKSLLNGPCGGSQDGKCELSGKKPEDEIPCAWQLIYDRMKLLGRERELSENLPPKDWSRSRDGGPRKIIREDLRNIKL